MFTKSVINALRQLYRNPGTSLFNVAGLAVGITTFTLLLFYIQKEQAYDRHNFAPEQLYRLVLHYQVEKDQNTMAWTAPAVADHMKNVVEAVRLFRYRSPVVMVDRKANKNFSEPNSIWADANVFKVFTFDFIAGNPESALTRPNAMVITESMAKKYFATTDAIGNVLSDITMNADFEITAVIRDMPATSHFKADFLCSLSTLPLLWGAETLESWGNSFLYTYMRVPEGVTREQLETSINELAAKHIQSSDTYTYQFALQPVTDIHLRSNVMNEWQPNSDVRYIYILTAVAALILLVSSINYINLWIARSEQRTKEIGIRQAIGGSRINLAVQFSIESLTHVVLALLISITLFNSATPLIDKLLGENILLSESTSVWTWLYIFIGVMVLISVVMLYPSAVISRVRPALAIKGKQATSGRGVNIWEGLIAFQILVTACLITGAILINRQVNFLKDRPLGYDADHLINISQLSNTALRDRLKDVLLRDSRVKSASGVSHMVGGTLYQSGYEISTNGKKETVLWQRMHTDHDFCRTFQIPIVSGRDFSRQVASDSANYVINETAAKTLGLTSEQAIGADVNGTGKIIGVMKDFHFKTLHSRIEPLIIHIVPDRIRMLTVNIRNADTNETMKWLEQVWKQMQPEEPLVYTTMKGYNAQSYRFEEKFNRVIVFFTLVVFLLSVSGLVSLNVYIANLRRKEIGIRKILGAETSSLLMNLSKRFAITALVGFVLSLPLSWYALNSWLNGFAYRVDITTGVFVVSGVITFVLSMMAIAIPTWRTAGQKAVTVLRSAE
ncbi:MAG: ABC transporter permease [Chryseolinea sp.]